MPDFTVIHLCSWYPTPYRHEHGIFHRQHIKAAALYSKQIVIYVAFENKIERKEKIIYEEANFKEIILIFPKKDNLFYKIKKIFIWLWAYHVSLREIFLNNPKAVIIHIHVVFPVGLIYLLNFRLRKLKLVISEQWSGYYPEDGNYKGFIRKWITREVFKRKNLLFVGADRMGQRLKEIKLTKDYVLLENVVPEYFFTQKQKERKKDSNQIRFLHISSLTDREKNISGMLRAFAEFKKKSVMPFTLTIAGGDEEKIKFFKDYAKVLGLDSEIRWLGRVNHHDLPEIYSEVDIFVLFSHFESQPVVVLEAWAMGLPVICTPVGQLPLWMKPFMGRCTKSHDVSDLLEVLLNVKEVIEKADTVRMKEFLINNFSDKAVGKKIYEEYKKLIIV